MNSIRKIKIGRRYHQLPWCNVKLPRAARAGLGGVPWGLGPRRTERVGLAPLGSDSCHINHMRSTMRLNLVLIDYFLFPMYDSTQIWSTGLSSLVPFCMVMSCKAPRAQGYASVFAPPGVAGYSRFVDRWVHQNLLPPTDRPKARLMNSLVLRRAHMRTRNISFVNSANFVHANFTCESRRWLEIARI
jgi:hypothetical protein